MSDDSVKESWTALWWLRDLHKQFENVDFYPNIDCHPKMTNLQCLLKTPCNVTPSVICVGVLPLLLTWYVTRPSYASWTRKWIFLPIVFISALMAASQADVMACPTWGLGHIYLWLTGRKDHPFGVSDKPCGADRPFGSFDHECGATILQTHLGWLMIVAWIAQAWVWRGLLVASIPVLLRDVIRAGWRGVAWRGTISSVAPGSGGWLGRMNGTSTNTHTYGENHGTIGIMGTVHLNGNVYLAASSDDDEDDGDDLTLTPKF